MNNYLLLGKAIAIASQAFEGVLDKGGKPYILHCLYVMNAMPADDPELQIIGVLHDLLEDTDWTLEELMDAGFSIRVITALALLTHDKSVVYDDYIKALATNPDCKLVKKADLRHNTDITRIKGLRKKDLDRMEKYHRSFQYLSE